ncbi:MAG: xanthine dehydrogenase family protein subunit M [Streptosporangiales bacterium]|nr:xanthine dehydrogenase family protein subunit M [Streptosporangiales bacterium]
MRFLRPHTWAEALGAKAEFPDALPLMGGTDVMVDVNFGRARPNALLDLTAIPELRTWAPDGDALRVGAGVTYARLVSELADRLPALAAASRTVGSPQIRNRGTAGGNLGSASPAGDAHPPLLAGGAEVELESVRGARRVAVEEFFAGPKRSVLEPDELIAGFRARPATGPQYFAKVGTRNAMVIAVCSFALALRPGEGVGTGIGSAGPTPLRAYAAEEFLAGELADRWEKRDALPGPVIGEFAELVAGAARPIDDVRGTADYRAHVLRVLARRTLTWAWADHCEGGAGCA